MKKLGFTLSELLITLGIIGVAAALVAPVVTNLVPDKNKIMFIKNYNSARTLTERMLNDPELYYPVYKVAESNEQDADGNIVKVEGRIYPESIGLENTGETSKAEYSDSDYATGSTKYAFILSQLLGVDKDKFEAETTSSTFRTPDRTCWYFEPKTVDGETKYNLFLIYNYEAEESCKNASHEVYSETNKKPNAFQLEVSRNGVITAADSLSKAYLFNPNNMHDKKRDLKCAEILSRGATLKSCASIEI